MSETATHPEPQEPRSKASEGGPVSEGSPVGGPTRTCVGCGERADVNSAADLVRLIIGPNGEIAVDARGGGFGRGAHVHARPECMRRAVERGFSRSAKARIHTIQIDDAEPAGVPLSVRSLAIAIQHAIERRIEGLLVSASRSKWLVLGSDAVKYASQRGEAELVVVATDAAAAAELTAVRIAVTEGRAVAWGSKERLGALLLRGKAGSGLAVLAITSRSIAGSLRDAARIADACAAVASGQAIQQPTHHLLKGSASRGSRTSPAVDAEGGNSQAGAACAPEPNSGKLGAPKGNVAPRGDGVRRRAASPRYEGATSGSKSSSSNGSRRDRRSDG
jgi:predicted RNA-binding protein YlxR (DUF448 family)/ribosomal protein L7Ae-like RNA K-turn-binding protein